MAPRRSGSVSDVVVGPSYRDAVDLLFSNGRLDVALHATEQTLIRDVEAWDADELLSQSEHEIAAYLAHKHSVHCPELKREEMYADEPTDARKALADDFYGRNAEITVSRLQIHVPYEGERVFFKLRPNSFTYNPPRASVSDTELVFTFEDRELNGDRVRNQLDRELRAIPFSTATTTSRGGPADQRCIGRNIW